MQKEHAGRHAGFELMRIVSMLMIVLMHGIGHGGLGSTCANGTLTYAVYWMLFILGRVSTNCFIMLTGFYMLNSDIKVSRLFRIDVQVVFYSLLTFGIAVGTGALVPGFADVLKALTPVTSEIYWFASHYFMLYLSVPLLNRVIRELTRGQYRVLLAGLFLTLSLWTTLCYWNKANLVNNGYTYIWFYALYFVAAYLRKYQIKASTRKCLVVYLVCSVAAILTRMSGVQLETKLGLTGMVDTHGGYQSPLALVASVAVFLIFQNVQIKTAWLKNGILTLAPLAFGVYLLHDSDFTRAWMWEQIDLPRFGGALLPSLGYLAVSVVGITLAGYLVDGVYQKLYRLVGFPKLEKCIDRVAQKVIERLERD